MKKNSETGTAAFSASASTFDDPALLQEIDRFVRVNEAAIIRDIARLVSIPSVGGPAEPDAPYGAEPKRALLCALQIAEELGLQTVNCENRIGYAVIGEDREPGYLATITHVAVVPAAVFAVRPHSMKSMVPSVSPPAASTLPLQSTVKALERAL